MVEAEAVVEEVEEVEERHRKLGLCNEFGNKLRILLGLYTVPVVEAEVVVEAVESGNLQIHSLALCEQQ